jgi:mRNA-degrading endonuclease toxin of MazEF toxin-antitoxin module
MTFERGDMVYGADQFKGNDYSRPWLIVSNDTHPFQGDQYVVLAPTSKTWHDGSVPVDDDAWIDGGAPNRSSVLPWSVETIEPSDIEHRQGTIEASLVDEAVSRFMTFVRSE